MKKKIFFIYLLYKVKKSDTHTTRAFHSATRERFRRVVNASGWFDSLFRVRDFLVLHCSAPKCHRLSATAMSACTPTHFSIIKYKWNTRKYNFKHVYLFITVNLQKKTYIFSENIHKSLKYAQFVCTKKYLS